MGYNGNLNARATEVITTQGDLRRGDSSGNPERLAVGSANQVLQSNGTTESWVTLSTGDTVLTTQGDILYEDASGLQRLGAGTAGKFLTTQGTGANPTYTTPTLSFIVSLTSETGSATVADGLAQIRMPFAFELSELPRAFCNTAPTGANLQFDITEAGSTIFSTKLEIDATEKTSTTATTPCVLSDSTLADDAIISFNCDQIGSTVAGAGIKLVLIGYQIV